MAVSRRRFLRVTAACAGGSYLGSAAPLFAASPERGATDRLRSRVALTRNAKAVDGPTVHRPVLREMLFDTLGTVTGASTIEDAWRMLLRPNEVVGIKFNRSGQRLLGTSATLAEELVRSMMSAGVPPGRIVCIEAPPGIDRELRTRPLRSGFAHTVSDFGSGEDQLAIVLSQITALINVPFLKTHNIAGFTCGLKNLSHGLVKHPARFHDQGCSPFIADIAALPEIRSKLRLTLVDALRVVFDGGPEPTAETIADSGTLIASVDPVAADAIGLYSLNNIRLGRKLERAQPSPGYADYLARASRRGLGRSSLERIEVVESVNGVSAPKGGNGGSGA
ncbi:MAG: DUF362 domain-containing protein [Phycisphaerae bacterium]